MQVRFHSCGHGHGHCHGHGHGHAVTVTVTAITAAAQAYDALDDPETADMHRVCPKFVAFKGPLSVGSPYQVQILSSCQPRQ